MVNIVFNVPQYALEYKEYRREVRAAVRSAATEIARSARAMIRSTVGAGVLYGKHRASAPGQPPANLTGALAGSIKLKSKAGGFKVQITDQAPYALFLEAGAKGGGGAKRAGRNKRGKPTTARVLEPRPFLSVAAEDNQADLQRRIEIALQRGVALRKVK